MSSSNHEPGAKRGGWSTGSGRASWIAHGLAVLAVLGVVAAITPTPGSTDRGFYEQLGRELIIRDCSDIHCFRPLVAGILEHLPGPSLPKWKAYAVLANTAAAIAVGQLCLLLGLSRPASIAATWLSALGTGSLYSLFDCYTADPLMYMMGPLLAIELWQGRTGRAGWIAAVGVFAKEFAAAPLWIFTAFAALTKRWPAAMRTLLVSTAIMIVWLSKHAGLMALQNYRYGFTASVDLLHGGYIASWLDRVGWAGAGTYFFTTFGALYVLLPAAFLRAGRDVRRLALASVPAALAFLYVEQPERALWNYQNIVIPVAVLALEGLPAWAIALFVAASGVVGLRFGAQLDIRWPARAALVIALAIAVAAVVVALRRRASVAQPFVSAEASAKAVRAAFAGLKPCATTLLWSIALLEIVALALLALVLIDIQAHRRQESTTGINQWGFRGPLGVAPKPGFRVAVVGGSAAFANGSPWWETVPALLAHAINQGKREPIATVDNLAEAGAGANTYVTTLRDYWYLRPDVICVFDGYDAVDAVPKRGRRESVVFRSTGYLPIVPRSPSDSDPGIAPTLQDGSSGAADPSCAGASAPYCSAMTEIVRFGLQKGLAVVVATPPFVSPRHERQQQSLGEQLGREFGREPRFRYVNLGRALDRGTLAAQLAGEIVAVLPHR